MPLPTETASPRTASNRIQLKFLQPNTTTPPPSKVSFSSSPSPSEESSTDSLTTLQNRLSHPSLSILPLAPSLTAPTFLLNQRHSLSRLRQRIHQVASKDASFPAPKLLQGSLNFHSVRDLKQSTVEKETKTLENLVNLKQDPLPNSGVSFWNFSHAPSLSSTPDVRPGFDLIAKKAESETRIAKPILVLDLDETLIHSSLVPRRPSDFWIEVIQNNDVRTREIFWVYKRPGVDQFLSELSRCYTIYIFTAGIKEYASQILDQLDPDGTIFQGRLYRDDCTEIKGQGTFAKDLTKISDALDRMVLVDNTPTCYSLQPENGIPIKSWYTDLYDVHLHRLREFLVEASSVPDIRHAVSEWSMY